MSPRNSATRQPRLNTPTEASSRLPPYLSDSDPGMTPSERRISKSIKKFKVTKEELLEGIRRLNERTRMTPPRKRDMATLGDHSPRTYDVKFGSWNRAVEAAGFTPRQKEEEIFQDRPESCPLCEERKTGLDFHHWRYGENKNRLLYLPQLSRPNPRWERRNPEYRLVTPRR